jgi:hypothetical protein
MIRPAFDISPLEMKQAPKGLFVASFRKYQ